MADVGQLDVADISGEYNQRAFQIWQLIGRVSTLTLVGVVAVSNAGDVLPVGTVTVQPLVKQLAGDGTLVPHGELVNVPVFRLQGGVNAVILDPEVGDIGVALFCDRDISSVKANRDVTVDGESRGESGPGSARRFDMSDGLYLGGFLNPVPTQYVRFSTDGIDLVSLVAILLQAPEVTIDAPTVAVNASTSFTVTSPAINLSGPVTQTGGDVSIADNQTVGGGVTATGEVIGSVVHATGSGHNL